jgi:hypothetical protein
MKGFAKILKKHIKGRLIVSCTLDGDNKEMTKMRFMPELVEFLNKNKRIYTVRKYLYEHVFYCPECMNPARRIYTPLAHIWKENGIK